MAVSPIALKVYEKANQKFNEGEFNFKTDTMVAIFVKTAYVPDDANDEFISDIVANEETNIARVTLTGKDVLRTAGVSNWDATDIALTNQTGDFAFVVFAKDTGNDATSPLYGYQEFADQSAVGVAINVNFDAEGLNRLTGNPA